MPLRIFSRGSPKSTINSSDSADMAGKEPSRPPLFPLQEVAWNSFASDGKNDLLTTPRSVVKWLSSSPLPDPPFFESQENFATISPEKPLSSLQSNLKMKLGSKDNKPRLTSAVDAESSSTSLRSSASSSGLQDTLPRNPSSEQKSLYATPHMFSNDSDPGTVADTPVARSLKYSQSAGSGAGSTSQHGSCTAEVVPAASLNSCSQPHFEIEEDPNFWKDHNVQVVIRLRPLSSSELATQGQSRCIRHDSAHAITWTGHPESRFTFDLVACETITQEKIFKVAGLPMVDNCLVGYNSCMFAYGQTGSGKTFTMLGDLEGADHRPSNNRGMTPRVFEYLFARIEQEEEARRNERLKFACKCSFLEIYNEQILDLLDPATANLQMREDARKGVYVENLSEVEVKNVQDVIRLLLQGSANRKVAATNMNRESSRSHSVFTCVIESKWTSQSVTNSRYGRLNLVDLAGSERQKSSGAEGERLKEAANINRSLSTLGLVIMSLVDIANGKQRHVPYRDSKLTFLLHDSLGGNSKTTIIANISPSYCCALETLSTLKFAQRAKFIRNNAIVNENASGDVMALRLQIQQLKQEVNRLRIQSMGGSGVELLPEGMMGTDGTCLELSNIGSIGHSAYSLEAWDSFQAFANPTFSSKRKNGLEMALLGSLRREQAGEARIRQLHAEIEHFKRLVKQREEDSQCGKMMLRFREDKIKRLESALGGLIPTDSYLLDEKNCLLEEVQILRTRLERNPEVTRFAMENIRLLEDLRRFQDFYEAGERDMMAEEISILRDQLLEALDWKLMHEQDPIAAGTGQDTQQNSSNGENKSFEKEVDSSKLEKQIETVGAVASMQAELIAMREAVVAATNGEMEARERVSLLTGEIEGLQKGLKELQEENARLCDMYQCALAEKDVIIKEFKRDRQIAMEKEDAEIVELRSALQAAQAISESVKLHKKGEDLVNLANVENENVNSDNSSHFACLQKNLEEMQEENARILGMYESALSERDVLLDKLNKDWQSTKEKDEEEKQELRISLHVAQEALEKMRLEQEVQDETTLKELDRGCKAVENEEIHELRSALQEAQQALKYKKLQEQEGEVLSIQNTDRNEHEVMIDVEGLQKGLKELQAENARLSAMYQSALSEKSAKTEELSRELQTAKEEKEMELNELRIALEVAQTTLESVSFIRSQDMDSSVRVLLEDHCAVLLRMDERVNELIQNVERKIEGLKISLDCINASAGELGQDKESLVTLIEKVCMEVSALLSILDEYSLENQNLHQDLDQTKLRLREAEQARDDVCLLSSVEKGTWMEDRRMLQEKLDTSLNLCNSREKIWNDSLMAFQSKLELVEAKLSDLSAVVDGTIVCMRNQCEGEKESLTETFFEIFKVEREVKLVEESHNIAQLKLKQEENKLNALRKVLDGFSSSKHDWFSREERMQDHVQMLSGVLEAKEMEISELQAEEENLKSCLDQLLKHEELMLLEAAVLKEKLQTAEEWRLDGAESTTGQKTQTTFSMLQLLRGEEEKATLLSVIADEHEKLKRIKVDIEHLKGRIDKQETALLCAQVEWEAATPSLQEAEAELEEIRKEKQVLLETEAEARAELETLTSMCSKAESEVRELEEQLKSSQHYLQGMKESFSQAMQSGSVHGTLDIGNDQQNKSILAEMLSDSRRFLLDIKCTVQNLGK